MNFKFNPLEYVDTNIHDLLNKNRQDFMVDISLEPVSFSPRHLLLEQIYLVFTLIYQKNRHAHLYDQCQYSFLLLKFALT